MLVPVGYMEILLSLACFLFLFLLRLGGKTRAAPRYWPVVGMLPGFVVKLHCIHEWTTEVLRESGCSFLFHGPWFSGMKILGTCDPANVNHVFNVNFPNYPKGEEFLEIFDVFGDGIFNADWDSWKTQRKEAHIRVTDPRFRQSVARTARRKVETGLVPVLSHAADRGSTLDLQDVFLRFTFDTTCTLVFGVDPGSLSPSMPLVPFSTAMDDSFEVIFFRHTVPSSWWKLMRRLRIGPEKRMALARKTIEDFIAAQISKKTEEVNRIRQEKGAEKEVAKNLLSSYIYQLSAGDASPESTKYLRDTTMNLMLAGRDATALTLGWVSWVVSQHPEVEQKILEELTATLQRMPESRRPERWPVIFSAEDVSSAVYLQATIHETMRLFPPIPFEHKGVVQADVLPSGDKVGPGTKILFSLYAMGRMEGIWGKDCCEFKPERWISERSTLIREPSYKFFAFSSGPRSCLGRETAFTQITTAAAAAIYNFRIKVVEGHVVAPKRSITLVMKDGMLAKVERRKP